MYSIGGSLYQLWRPYKAPDIFWQETSNNLNLYLSEPVPIWICTYLNVSSEKYANTWARCYEAYDILLAQEQIEVFAKTVRIDGNATSSWIQSLLFEWRLSLQSQILTDKLSPRWMWDFWHGPLGRPCWISNRWRMKENGINVSSHYLYSTHSLFYSLERRRLQREPWIPKRCWF